MINKTNKAIILLVDYQNVAFGTKTKPIVLLPLYKQNSNDKLVISRA